MTAIILDAHLASALSAVRSLGKRGVRVVCGGERKTAMSFYSKYCRQSFVYPNPLKDPAGFVEKIKTVSDQLLTPVIYSFSDNTFLPWQRSGGQSENIEIAFDKKRTLALAESLAIPVPKTLNDQENLNFPVAIKPRHNCSWLKVPATFETTVFAYSLSELKKKKEAIFQRTGEEPIIQEYVEGEERGLFFLFDQGQPLTVFAHRRLRSINPAGGASSLRESITVPEKLLAYSLKLMASLKWQGPAMLEFKGDKLMEINGRFWGSLPLAIFSGVDFPWLYYQLATGQRPDSPQSYKIGIKSRNLLADFRNFWRWPFGRDLYYDVFSGDDPQPFFREFIDVLSRKIFMVS